MTANEAAERLREFLAEISNDQPSDALRDLADALTRERSAGADVERIIATLALDLQTATLVGNPAPVVKEMDERMSAPKPGDLVWERTTRPGRIGILSNVEQEPVAAAEDWDGDLPIPTETVYYIERLNGEIERWVDADFLSLVPAARLAEGTDR